MYITCVCELDIINQFSYQVKKKERQAYILLNFLFPLISSPIYILSLNIILNLATFFQFGKPNIKPQLRNNENAVTQRVGIDTGINKSLDNNDIDNIGDDFNKEKNHKFSKTYDISVIVL